MSILNLPTTCMISLTRQTEISMVTLIFRAITTNLIFVYLYNTYSYNNVVFNNLFL